MIRFENCAIYFGDSLVSCWSNNLIFQDFASIFFVSVFHISSEDKFQVIQNQSLSFHHLSKIKLLRGLSGIYLFIRSPNALTKQ